MIRISILLMIIILKIGYFSPLSGQTNNTSQIFICGEDDTCDAICYENSNPEVYEKSKTILRLQVKVRGNDDSYCTGFLLGSEGHFMTANHCIVEDGIYTIEVMAESHDCDNCTNDGPCSVAGGCPGTLISTGFTLIQSNSQYDFALYKLDDNISLDYGYLSLSSSGPKVSDEFYIPQHPQGFAKRIALNSDHQDDVNGICSIQNTFFFNECGIQRHQSDNLGYWADGNGGASGAPLISLDNHCVIGIHQCGGCPFDYNRGVSSAAILEHLNYIPDNAVWVPEDCTTFNELNVYRDRIFEGEWTMESNLIIHEGVTVEVKGTLKFAENSNLIVKLGGKLKVNGGIITACDSEWSGIIVEGVTNQNNKLGDAGKVELTNMAILEKAETAISMDPSHIPFSYLNYGGYVYANNAIIQDCIKGIEFMLTNDDASELNNVTFLNIKDNGTSHWRNDGVTYRGCTFRNVGYGSNYQEGILALTSSITVENECLFENCPTGIAIINTDLNFVFPCKISGNRFLDCEDAGILVMTSFPGIDNAHDISRNRIKNSYRGIDIDGESGLFIMNNTIEDCFHGIFSCNSAQNWDNPIHSNDFDGNTAGIAYVGENNMCTFITNCFNSEPDMDVVVADCHMTNSNGMITIAPGAIGSLQGGNLEEAGNCFGTNGSYEILNLGPPISYFVENTRSPNECQRTPDSWGISEIGATDKNSPDNCGSDLPPIIGSCRIHFTDPTEILGLIADIDHYLNNPLTDAETRTAQGLRHGLLVDLADMVSEGQLDDNISASTLNYLSNRPEFSSRTLVVGHYIRTHDYMMARNSLLALSPQTVEESDYVFSQDVYLDYLESGRTGVEMSKLLALAENARNASPFNSYSRSVHYVITGERIVVPFPDIDLPVQQRAKSDVVGNLQIECYPNPNNDDVLYLNIQGRIVPGVTLNIYDQMGTEMFISHNLEEQLIEITTSHYNSGFYFVIIKDDSGDIITSTKFLKVK